MIAPLARSFLRYLAGYLVIKNVIPADIAEQIANDPDLAMLIGGGIMLAVEGFWIVARRQGWSR